MFLHLYDVSVVCNMHACMLYYYNNFIRFLMLQITERNMKIFYHCFGFLQSNFSVLWSKLCLNIKHINSRLIISFWSRSIFGCLKLLWVECSLIIQTSSEVQKIIEKNKRIRNFNNASVKYVLSYWFSSVY